MTRPGTQASKKTTTTEPSAPAATDAVHPPRGISCAPAAARRVRRAARRELPWSHTRAVRGFRPCVVPSCTEDA
jgi:hypothetical protein